MNEYEQHLSKLCDTIASLRDRVKDAETSLRIYDHGGDSEYWLRYKDSK